MMRPHLQTLGRRDWTETARAGIREASMPGSSRRAGTLPMKEERDGPPGGGNLKHWRKCWLNPPLGPATPGMQRGWNEET